MVVALKPFFVKLGHLWCGNVPQQLVEFLEGHVSMGHVKVLV